MGGQSRLSHKYLLLQVWCGLLTVAMVIMAALLISMKPKSTEDKISPAKPDNVSLTDGSSMNTLKSRGSSLSYIQLITSPTNRSWQVSPGCQSCSLVLHNNSINCRKASLYFIYAQVTFSKLPKNNDPKSVILKRDASLGRSVKKLVEGTFPHTTEGSVWVAKIVSLTEGDSISLDIAEGFLTDSTFWGAYQLH